MMAAFMLSIEVTQLQHHGWIMQQTQASAQASHLRRRRCRSGSCNSVSLPAGAQTEVCRAADPQGWTAWPLTLMLPCRCPQAPPQKSLQLLADKTEQPVQWRLCCCPGCRHFCTQALSCWPTR